MMWRCSTTLTPNRAQTAYLSFDLRLSPQAKCVCPDRITGWLKRSGLPVGKTLENFDFTFAHGVDRRKVELLATCEFATRHETVLGPSGIGKTHLAAGLAAKAITNGFGVWFVTADDLTQMLHRDEQAPPPASVSAATSPPRCWSLMNWASRCWTAARPTGCSG